MLANLADQFLIFREATEFVVTQAALGAVEFPLAFHDRSHVLLHPD
jgi:hypothetical protein